MAKNIWRIAKKEIIIILALFAILLLGNKLRSYNYDTVPHPGETADEYDFAWVGLSLIQQGIPIGWTGIVDAGQNIWYEKINVDNLDTNDPEHFAFRMTKPWFDHPPGFALIIGGYSYLKGARQFYQTGVGIIRRPMLRIAILTTFLIFVLATRLYNKWVGLLSALLYSIIPTAVISSRLVLAENGYIPLFLGALILADLYLKKKKRAFLILAAIISAVAILFKLSGIAVLISLLLIILAYDSKREKLRNLTLVFIIGISGLVAFFAYGAYYDWEVFKNVFFAQAGRLYGSGAEVFLSAVTQSKITATKFLSDGWILASWVATFIVSIAEWKKRRGTTILTISVFSYLIVFIIFGSESFGWYRFPFLSLIIIELAYFIEKVLREPNFFAFLGISLFPFGTSLHRLYGIEGFSKFVPWLRVALVFLLSVFAGTIFIDKIWMKRVYQLVVLAILAFLCAMAIKEIYFLDVNAWYRVS
ncbi:glycosyltransferase family 39 protein [Patescibacteria group bacterium]|nr:glycosyltransferase family 39 protein [Patescibacteria group bacterium]